MISAFQGTDTSFYISMQWLTFLCAIKIDCIRIFPKRVAILLAHAEKINFFFL